MSKKLTTILLSIFACLLFCWILPVMFFLPNGSEYVYNRMFVGIYGTLIALGITFIMLKIDKKKFSDIGFTWERYTLTRFLKGGLIGALIVIVVITIMILTTDYTIVYNQDVIIWKALVGLIAFLPLAFM